ncbi:MAG: PsiF repeat-containing protein [Betaproteobacteria bacterium HGW-Betaproteobacteria-13]|jgi:hypothetical protein|nr:MAG: PsiF repeat-containing protein [Betaproteobacteria bacterium HGW-Betaproteobacteria-13]
MKGLILTTVAATLLATLSPADAWANPQHERMKTCNQEARTKALKGDDRKQFMSTCLKGKHAAGVAPAASPASRAPEPVKGKAQNVSATSTSDGALQAAQKEKMKGCSRNASEKALKGNERKAFMSECLKG